MKLLIASLLLAVVAAIGTSLLLLLQEEEAPDAVVQAELAGVKFAYVRAFARDDATAAGGLADRLSFMASFPTFAPIKSNDRAANALILTLSPKDDGIDPSERPSKLYARFLTPETSDGPGGLVLRRFEQGSPYDSEELFVAQPDGPTFFARCPKPEISAPGEGCISVFRQGTLDVELRYAPTLLEQWDALYEGAQALVARMTAGPARKTKR